MHALVKLASFTPKSRFTCERINQQIPTVAKEYSHKNSVQLRNVCKEFHTNEVWVRLILTWWRNVHKTDYLVNKATN